MLKILITTFPFFALVLCGYLAARRRLLPLEAVPGLNGFVLFFALPCMLYRFGVNTPMAQLLDAGVLLTWTCSAAVLIALTVAYSRRRGIGWNDAAFGALVAVFPNSGFMGVPLLVALLGAAAAGPVIFTMVIDMIVTTSLCIALSRWDSADAHGAGKALRQALRGVLSNPMPWALVVGVLVAVWAVPVPAALTQTIGLLADAASPVALFTIGAVLARSQMRSASGHAPTPRLGDYLPVALAKLLLHPLLVWGIGTVLMQAGWPLSQPAFTAVVLTAALPSASNVSLLAERFDADNGRIARIILVTTAAAFGTFSLAVALLA